MGDQAKLLGGELQELGQVSGSAVIERHVVEGVSHDGFGDGARLRSILTDDEDARVVVGHRQATVVLGIGRIRQYDGARVGEGRPDGPLFARVDQDRGAVGAEQSRQSFLFDLSEAAQGPPGRDPELVAADIRVARLLQLRAESLASAAIGTVAVENQRLGAIGDLLDDLG